MSTTTKNLKEEAKRLKIPLTTINETVLLSLTGKEGISGIEFKKILEELLLDHPDLQIILRETSRDSALTQVTLNAVSKHIFSNQELLDLIGESAKYIN